MFGLLGGLVGGLGKAVGGIGKMLGGGGPMSGLLSSMGPKPGSGLPMPSSQSMPQMPQTAGSMGDLTGIGNQMMNTSTPPQTMAAPPTPPQQTVAPTSPITAGAQPSLGEVGKAAVMPKIDSMRAMIADQVAKSKTALPTGFYEKMAEIESPGLNPNAVSPTGAKGLFQFTDRTWKAYGKGDPLNPVANTQAGIKYANDNYNYLTSKLGRPAEPYEVYMAHNLGPGGAMKLINANPNMPLSRGLIGSSPTNNPKFLMDGDNPISAGEAIQRYRSAFSGI